MVYICWLFSVNWFPIPKTGTCHDHVLPVSYGPLLFSQRGNDREYVLRWFLETEVFQVGIRMV